MNWKTWSESRYRTDVLDHNGVRIASCYGDDNKWQAEQIVRDHGAAAALEAERQAKRDEWMRAEGLWQAIENALYDYDHRDEISMVDRLRYALAAHRAPAGDSPATGARDAEG